MGPLGQTKGKTKLSPSAAGRARGGGQNSSPACTLEGDADG